MVFVDRGRLGIVSHLSDDPWRAVTSVFVYDNALVRARGAAGDRIYGWRLELRHGPAVVVVLFLLGGVGGIATAGALESTPSPTAATGWRWRCSRRGRFPTCSARAAATSTTATCSGRS